VQQPQLANRELRIEAAIAKLDKDHPLILDDIAYAAEDQAETSVLFELIAVRYERRSWIKAYQAFGVWHKVANEKPTRVTILRPSGVSGRP
jgi:DNA replication protein DnaC